MVQKFEEFHKINEEGVAAANATGSGMGAVVTATPASVPGAAFTGDGTVGSGDIGVPYSVSTKKPANLSNKKEDKKEKEPKKYKFSDMIKFENFDITKYLLENFDIKSMDSKEFETLMKKVEASLKKVSKKKAKDWKDVLQSDIFNKLSVKNWKEAYEKDPSACLAYKSRLDDYFNKPEESLTESTETVDANNFERKLDQIEMKLKEAGEKSSNETGDFFSDSERADIIEFDQDGKSTDEIVDLIKNS